MMPRLRRAWSVRHWLSGPHLVTGSGIFLAARRRGVSARCGSFSAPRSSASCSLARTPGCVCVSVLPPNRDLRVHSAAQRTHCRRADQPRSFLLRRASDTRAVADLNVLGGALAPCGTDPITGFFRDGCCHSGPEDLGSHTVCAVVTAEFLDHQQSIGNDLVTPMPEYRFAGLVPGDRWCVTAANWLRAHLDGAAAYVVLASTHKRALEIIPLDALREHAVDVPPDPGLLQR
jgi:uncharacterized protein